MTKNPRSGGRHRPDRARTRRVAPRPLSRRGRAGRRPNLAVRGQLFGFAALVLILVTVVVLAKMGQPVLAGVVTTTGLVGVVGVFVTGRFPTPASDGSKADDEMAEPETKRPP